MVTHWYCLLFWKKLGTTVLVRFRLKRHALYRAVLHNVQVTTIENSDENEVSGKRIGVWMSKNVNNFIELTLILGWLNSALSYWTLSDNAKPRVDLFAVCVCSSRLSKCDFFSSNTKT